MNMMYSASRINAMATTEPGSTCSCGECEHACVRRAMLVIFRARLAACVTRLHFLGKGVAEGGPHEQQDHGGADLVEVDALLRGGHSRRKRVLHRITHDQWQDHRQHQLPDDRAVRRVARGGQKGGQPRRSEKDANHVSEHCVHQCQRLVAARRLGEHHVRAGGRAGGQAHHQPRNKLRVQRRAPQPLGHSVSNGRDGHQRQRLRQL